MPKTFARPAPHDADALWAILEQTSAETGQKYFAGLVQRMARALGTAGAWVTEYFEEKRRLRALSFWMDEGWIEGYEIGIAGTPCEAVIETANLVHFPDRLLELFPGDDELRVGGS